ncbi:MAG TPA: cyclic nucleotide-binding domain-containing protein [Actinomycetota bacterium]|nr:cyclic nucleotide-binding domain-containing protein [Actinomycetota bacterium]
MTDRDDLDKLRRVPLFSALDDAALARVADLATEFDAAHGHVLVERGRPGAGLFVIEEGSVVVELRDREVTLGAGEFFGEIALLDDTASHVARVKAASPVRGVALARDDFMELLRGQPAIAITMLRTLAHRLGDSVRH